MDLDLEIGHALAADLGHLLIGESLDMLEDEEDLELRRELIWALSKIGGEGVRDRLEELLDAETDDDEADFIEEAMDNLTFTEDMGNFDLFGLDPDADLHEEEVDDEDEPDND